MLDDEKELLIPGSEEAVGVARVVGLVAGKHEGCTARQLLPGVPVQGGPSAVCPVPEQLWSCTLRLVEQGWVNMRATELKRV